MTGPPTDKPMVELTRVSKIYHPDVVALEEVSLRVEKGEMVFITGMSGAGKTSLLKLICAIEAPTKGLIEVAGWDLNRLKPKDLPPLRQQVGMAYQDFKLLADRTVAQNVAMALEVAYQDGRTIRHCVAELLQILRLAHKHDTLTGNLSRGEQQRVALARALANSPAVVLADEPTGNLDSSMTEIVISLLEKVNHDGGTVIIATHDESIYRHSRHRILDICHGRLTPINSAADRIIL